MKVTFYTLFITLLIGGSSVESLFGKRKIVNLKYERLWTDILPKDLSIWGEGKHHYRNDFRKKYIALFIVPCVDESYSYKTVLDFIPFMRKYALKYKEHISLFIDGSDRGIEAVFGKTLNENIFQIHGNIYKRKGTVYTNHDILLDEKYTSEPSSPRWLLIFDDRGRYVDNVRIEIIDDINNLRKYLPWQK